MSLWILPAAPSRYAVPHFTALDYKGTQELAKRVTLRFLEICAQVTGATGEKRKELLDDADRQLDTLELADPSQSQFVRAHRLELNKFRASS